jgi:hypothetical protein
MTALSARLIKDFKNSARLLIEFCGEEVVVRQKQGAGFVDLDPIPAKVSAYRVQDLIPGASARIGDLVAIVMRDDLPPELTRLESKDRVTWRGRDYAVMNYDDATSSLAGQGVVVTMLLRGG